MAGFQILQKGPTAGQGALLGLGEGLRSLASEKLGQIRAQNEQRQLSQTLQSLGYNPAQAALIGQLPVNQRLEALQGLAPAGQQVPQAQSILQLQQEAPTQYSAAAQQRQQELQPQVKAPSAFDLGQEANRIKAGLPESEQPFSVTEAIKSIAMINGQKPSAAQRRQIEERVNELNNNPEKRQELEQQYANAVKNGETIEIRKKGFEGPAVPFERAVQQLAQTPRPLIEKPGTAAQRAAIEQKERAAEEKRSTQERKEKHTEEVEAAKETKQFYLDTTKEASGAKKNEARLNRMEELINKGSLPISAFYNLSKSLSETESLKNIPLIGGIINPIANGIGIGLREIQRNVTSRDLEEFEKLSNSFIETAKSIFGSRLTDADLKAFMQTVPTLSQSDAGKKQIIESMRASGQAALLKDKVMKQIIKANDGKRPLDLEIQVEERAKPELDRLAGQLVGRPSIGLF